jgi:hypothetical protein
VPVYWLDSESVLEAEVGIGRLKHRFWQKYPFSLATQAQHPHYKNQHLHRTVADVFADTLTFPICKRALWFLVPVRPAIPTC